MYLLNTTTLRLRRFPNSKTVRYAILSHRWGKNADEITFDDIQMEDRAELEQRKGWDKIVDTCAKARWQGLEWAWIDTCCIDRNNAAELADAITHMFEWYKDSVVCFAFLSDVKAGEDPSDENSTFRKSVWFTRGWTLQELIAPSKVIFYAPANNAWLHIGTKESLVNVITQITDIDSAVLEGGKLSKVSVARRMSWAANRKTKEVEDRAYSLAGIFDVTLSPAYGEGARSFKRLQIEIAKVSNDNSLFAWVDLLRIGYTGSIFAPDPDCFCDSSDIINVKLTDFTRKFSITEQIQEYMITNEGLRIRLPFVIDDEKGAALERIARPLRWAKKASTYSRTWDLIQKHTPTGDLLRTSNTRKIIRIFLACKFSSTDSFVSIPLSLISDGRYRRSEVYEDISILDSGKPSFYSIQIDTFYISTEDIYPDDSSDDTSSE